MRRLPYGISNFAELRRRRLFFADKTGFLPALEDAEKGRFYLTFLRPRRMGKTLLLSMMEHYYDLLQAPQFEELFGGLAIAKAPTEERGRYAVLRLEMTGMTTSAGLEALREDFLARLRENLQYFVERYRSVMPAAIARFEASRPTNQPASVMYSFLSAMQLSPHKLYVLIDEYDNFSNDLIARGDHGTYREAIHASGFVREFYKTIKEGTARGTVGRIFMTGVSPVTLDDFTSGFNITKNISLHEDFNALCGFTEADVEEIVAGFLDEPAETESIPPSSFAGPAPAAPAKKYTFSPETLRNDLRRYYNGYLFSRDGTERIFNPDMMLHFLTELRPPDKYPNDILDMNVRTDYGRIKKLFFTSEGATRPEVIESFESILRQGHVRSEPSTSFPLDQAHRSEYFLSLLYYMGLLTLQKEDGWVRMGIPNYAIRTLYWEAMPALLADLAPVEVASSEVRKALETMSRDGDMKPFLDIVFTKALRKLSNRDLIRLDEKTMKVLLLAYLSLSNVFFAWSEVELGFGYGDLVLVPNRSRPAAKVGLLIELKYLKAGATGEAVTARLAEAEAQLERYLADEKLRAITPAGGFRAVSVAFVGTEACYLKALGGEAIAVGAGSHEPEA